MENTLYEQSMKTAEQCGAYKAIAGMMAEAIRRLDAAEAGSFDADFARTNLTLLAKQFEENKEKFEKEVDNLA